MNTRLFLTLALLSFSAQAMDKDGVGQIPGSNPVLAALNPARPVSTNGAGEDTPNLLNNASFEDGETGWNFSSYRHAGVVSVDNSERHEGKASIRIENSAEDDSSLKQTVAVKPKTRYRLSGYIKTQDVGAMGGANLSVEGGFEKTESLAGDHDWTKVSVLFHSGSRDSVKVGARLGHHGRLATGVAWFDDLSLIELAPVWNEGDSSGRVARNVEPNAASDDSIDRQPKLLRISATVDGSGRMIFTRNSLRYEHRHWSPPSNVIFDGEPWSNLSRTPAAWEDVASRLDLANARIVKRQGRDVIALEQTLAGFDLYFSDSPNGAANYEVTLSIPRRR